MESDHPVLATLFVATKECLRCRAMSLAEPRMAQAEALLVDKV